MIQKVQHSMAGNKKPSRKRGERTHIFVKVTQLRENKATARLQQQQERNTMIQMRNTLPLGHELNRHKIGEVFGPIEALLHELETTGEAPVDADDKLVFWCEAEDEWMPLGDSLLSMCMMLDLVSRNFTWGRIPTGLRDLAMKLDADTIIDQHDTAAARAALEWIRRRVAEVTPNQWGAAYQEACAIVDARDALQQAAPPL